MRDRFSRTNETCVLGGLTAELPKVKVPEETFEILRRRAASAGMTLTEYLRMRALLDAHGYDEVQRMQRERLEVVAGKRHERGKKA